MILSSKCSSLKDILPTNSVGKKFLSNLVPKQKKNEDFKVTPHYLKVLEHFSKTDIIRDSVKTGNLKTNYVLRTAKFPEALYLMNPSTANYIVDEIRDELCKSNTPVIELNPGLGILTNVLMSEKGISKIYSFEADSVFKKKMFELEKMNPERLKVIPFNFAKIWRDAYHNNLNGNNRIENLLLGIEKKEWNDSPCFKVVGALPNIHFFWHFLHSLINQSGIISYGRPELFFLLSPGDLFKVKQTIFPINWAFHPITFFFEHFFDFILFGSVKKKDFIPWTSSLNSSKVNKITKIYNLNADEMYLVKLTPKRNLFEILPIEFLKPLWFFTKHNLRAKKTKIIGEMEKWVPGCGPRLISRGINIFDEFSSLPPQDFFDLFIEFTKWPEYQSSSFIAAMDSYFLGFDNN